MRTIAVNLELLFTEAGTSVPERIRAAAASGFDAVEIWGWRDKDVDGIHTALTETGVRLLSLIVDPQPNLADPSTHERYLHDVRESLAVAERLGSPNLVVVSGAELSGVDRAEQRTSIVDVLGRAARILDGSGVRLLLEPLNTRVDHPGALLSSTREGLDIVKEVGSPRLRLLLDAYHALVMDEDLGSVIGEDAALIGHVQVADAPGRHEPGTGDVDWERQFRLLRRLGYEAHWGMEYLPTLDTLDSLAEVRAIAARVDG